MSKLKLVHVGDAARDVVVKLAPRIGGKPAATPADKSDSPLMSQLRASVARLADCQQEKMDEAGWKAFCEANVIKGRNKIAEGIELIRKGAGPDAAIRHLRNELAAIDPTFEPREF